MNGNEMRESAVCQWVTPYGTCERPSVTRFTFSDGLVMPLCAKHQRQQHKLLRLRSAQATARVPLTEEG